MREEDTYRPKVLLLGNGLNRTYGGDTWGEMVDKLHSNPRVAKE